VIHRDVSPHNILLSTSGEVKLADFGIAKACVSAVRTRTGVVKGKLSYMSPEQAAGRRLDVRSDLYSLGVILWEMLAGRRLHGARKDVPPQVLLALPRDAAPAAEARPDVDPALAELVDAMLAVDPGRRPPSPAAALEVLARTGVEASTPLALGERVRRSRPPDPEPDGAMAPTAPQSVHPDPAETKDESPPDPLDSGDILTDAPGDSTPPAVSRPAERTPRPRPPRRWLVLAAAVAAGVTLAAAILLAGLERLSRELEVDVPPARTAAPAAPAPSSSPARPARRAPPPLDAAPPSQEADEPPAAAGTSASAAGPARRGSGTLDVNARPWADVYLDGRKVGQTPLRLPKVRAGRHVVQLVNPDLGAKKKIGVKVRAGATVAVSHDFSSVWHDPVPPSQE
jgi:serine/threonine-protein kinase